MGAASNSDYFYYGTTKKIVTVFGMLFNNISVARQLSDGTLANVMRVPLSYGPRDKFLSRIVEDKGPELAIKLPRMSFEITGIAHDSASKLNAMNRRQYHIAGTNEAADAAYPAVPYDITFTLDIYGRNMDEALQILEQIIPIFTPEYTMAVKGMEGPDSTTMVPFILDDVALTDDYEGEFVALRPIIYTLSFTAKAKYLGAITREGVILRATANMRDPDDQEFAGEKTVAVPDDEGNSTSYISNVNPDQHYLVEFGVPVQYVEGENLIGIDSGHAGLVESTTETGVVITKLENLYNANEQLFGDKSDQSFMPISITLQD